MKISNLMMPWVPMSKGLRQGSPLSPLLLNIFLTLLDIEKLERDTNAKVRLYADDVAVICPTAEGARRTDDYIRKEFSKYGLIIELLHANKYSSQKKYRKNWTT